MAHEETVYEIMQKLVIADTKTVAEIMSARGIWTAGQSAYQNTYKAENILTALGKIKKGSDYWKLPECKSEFAEHAKQLSQDLATILKVFPDSIIYREQTIETVGLRPDALILIRRGGDCLCVIYECALQERPEFLLRKENIWKTWDGALIYLSKLFHYKIQQFEFITSDTLQEFMEGL